MFLNRKITTFTGKYSDNIRRLQEVLRETDAVLIGAGSGVSTSAGFTYSGKRFADYFQDFGEKYGFSDMYSGGFYPYETLEEFWAYWSRFIFINRYMDAPKPVYEDLYELVKDRDYFVLTTNVDHCFQKAGFDRHRLFYTQGDYGLFQCSGPCCQKTYDNESVIRRMVEAQGYVISESGTLSLPEGTVPEMAVPSELVPYCPKCGRPMSMNLRSDDSFVEDEGWHRAAQRCETFLRTRYGQRMLFLELGVGYNTPGIIKYPFWKMTMENPKAVYVVINCGEASCPAEIKRRSICINADIDSTLSSLFAKGGNPLCG